MKYDEDERINWDDIFNFPKFKDLSIELSTMNLMH